MLQPAEEERGWDSGKDAWSREMQRVYGLAAALGITLDAEMMLLSDVRDLQALKSRLSRRVAATGGRAMRDARFSGVSPPAP